jgi:DNA-binding SARP family transcriptional activator
VGTGWQFAILGPLEVRAGGTLVHVGGPRQRALLGLLLCHANRVVSRDELTEELLGDQPSGTADRMLRVQISRLRQVLTDRDGTPRVAARPPGYVLRVEPGELDLQVFEQRVTAGRAALGRGDPGQAVVLLGEAESLWRGRLLADLEFEPFARFEIQRLAELRLLATEDRIEAELALGHHTALCPQLGRLVAEHPLRERLRGQLMLALYRSGRQADALEAYRAGWVLLVEELGVEPGHGLRRVHEQVLAADPALDLPTPTPTPAPANAGSPADQPPPAVPRELPPDVSAFTGRAIELAELDLLLPGPADQEEDSTQGAVVISAVAGTAGVGKTTLAVRWAHRVAGQFPDGQLYVNLRGYDPSQPLTAGAALAGFLRALGLADADIPLEEAERAARYRSLVAGKRLLVVLDNAATEDQARPLLPGSGSAMVVVTSRDSLAGLVARDGAHRLDLDLLPQGEAVALLYALIGQRAEAEHTAVEALAGQCARLPLALRVAAELAVSRPGTPLAELVAELADERNRLEFLDGGGDPRAAVASVFSWSYRHLPADAARMFRLLGLHPGADWDQYAAAALTGTRVAQAGRLLGVLARAHLIQPAGPGRHSMHDLLRAYSAGLAGDHDSDQARRAALTGLFDYYLAAYAAAMDCLSPAARHRRPALPPAGAAVPKFGDLSAALAWLDAERATLTAVAAYTAGHGWPGHTTCLAATLATYFDFGHDIEAIVTYTHALNAARATSDRAAQAFALTRLGRAHARQGRHQQAVGCLRKAVSLARDSGDRGAQARALQQLLFAYQLQSNYQRAARYGQQALALYRELGDQSGEIANLLGLGEVYRLQGRYQQAFDHAEQAFALSCQLNDQLFMTYSVLHLGQICYGQGRYQQAVRHLQEALRTARERGDKYVEAGALVTLGEVKFRQGQLGEATEYNQQALTLSRETGDREIEGLALNTAGEILLAAGQPGQAHARHTAALTLTRQTGDRYQQARALTRLGELSRHQGHLDRAADYDQQAVALFLKIGARAGQAGALNGAAATMLLTGQPTQARDCSAAALALAHRTGDRYQQARAHHGLAATCQATGDTREADRHWGHALDIYTDLGVPEATQMRTKPNTDQTKSPVRSL